jgi:hypothetical protein
MCFSAGASFAGGVIISAIGIATVRKVHKSSQLVFASIPLFFGIQQIVEGCLWMFLPEADQINAQKTTTFLYLILAQVLWPTIIPVSVLLMEENKKRKKMMRTFLALGLLLSSYYAFCLIFFMVTPRISGYHILYTTTFPDFFAIPAFIVYLIATITPLFISGVRKTHFLAILMFLSCVITAIFFTQYLISVWCFFAAIISGVIYWILNDSKKEFDFELLSLLRTGSNTNNMN